jgi:hypothetical protein
MSGAALLKRSQWCQRRLADQPGEVVCSSLITPPPSIHRRAAPAQSTPPGPLSQRWANLPPETRRRLSQILARVIARHRLPHNRKEVPDD